MSDSNSTATTLENWDAVRQEIQNRYPQIGGDDLNDVGGDSRRLVALLHQRTGGNVSEIEDVIDDIAARSGGLLSRLRHSVATAAEGAGDQIGAYATSARDTVVGGYDSAREGVEHCWGSTCEAIERRPVEAVAFAFTAGALFGFTVIRSMLTPPPPPTLTERVGSWWSR